MVKVIPFPFCLKSILSRNPAHDRPNAAYNLIIYLTEAYQEEKRTVGSYELCRLFSSDPKKHKNIL